MVVDESEHQQEGTDADSIAVMIGSKSDLPICVIVQNMKVSSSTSIKTTVSCHPFF